MSGNNSSNTTETPPSAPTIASISPSPIIINPSLSFSLPRPTPTPTPTPTLIPTPTPTPSLTQSQPAPSPTNISVTQQQPPSTLNNGLPSVSSTFQPTALTTAVRTITQGSGPSATVVVVTQTIAFNNPSATNPPTNNDNNTKPDNNNNNNTKTIAIVIPCIVAGVVVLIAIIFLIRWLRNRSATAKAAEEIKWPEIVNSDGDRAALYPEPTRPAMGHGLGNLEDEDDVEIGQTSQDPRMINMAGTGAGNRNHTLQAHPHRHSVSPSNTMSGLLSSTYVNTMDSNHTSPNPHQLSPPSSQFDHQQAYHPSGYQDPIHQPTSYYNQATSIYPPPAAVHGRQGYTHQAIGSHNLRFISSSASPEQQQIAFEKEYDRSQESYYQHHQHQDRNIEKEDDQFVLDDPLYSHQQQILGTVNNDDDYQHQEQTKSNTTSELDHDDDNQHQPLRRRLVAVNPDDDLDDPHHHPHT